MKKIVIGLSIVLLAVFAYTIFQLKSSHDTMIEAGYTGSISNGSYVKKTTDPNDIESYINRNSVFDANSYALSFHYFVDEEQVSIYQKINNNKSQETLFSYNAETMCPIIIEGDNITVDKNNENYQISCVDADLTSDMLKEALVLFEEVKAEVKL